MRGAVVSFHIPLSATGPLQSGDFDRFHGHLQPTAGRGTLRIDFTQVSSQFRIRRHTHMMLKIPNVLSREQIETAKNVLATAKFVDGKLTAGRAANDTKFNEEADNSEEQIRKLNEMIMGTMCNHPTFRTAALPTGVSPAYFARYGPGMSYGYHVDAPVGMNHQNRADIALTIFLSDVDEYDGGELSIHTSFGEQHVKLPAGDAVVYPASSLHRVREVTRGQRLVAVAWTQSMIRDPARRELLYELGRARDLAHSAGDSAREQLDILQQVHANLMRMWAEV